MKELVETIAKALVDNPDVVHVNMTESEDDVVMIELSAASEDLGKIIGKQGKIANSIRTIVKACAIKEDKKVMVEIIQ